MKSRLLIIALAIALGAALIGGATMAIFWDTDTEGPVQFTAGTLLIEIDDFEMVSTDIDLDLLNPGDEWCYKITIKNAGTKTFEWKGIFHWADFIGIENYLVDGDGNRYVTDEQIAHMVARNNAGVPGAPYGTEPLSDVLVFTISYWDEGNWAILTEGTLEGKTAPLKITSPVNIPPGESVDFRICVEFPLESGNEYQGSKMQAGFAVLAWQTGTEQPDWPPDCEGETAWGGDTEGDGPAWWFYFDTDGPENQTLWAGQIYNAGGVTIQTVQNGDQVTISIVLADGWELQAVEEPVKIQGYSYANVPGFRPPPGPFTTYKGNDLVVVVQSFDVYAIHLDVQRCW